MKKKIRELKKYQDIIAESKEKWNVAKAAAKNAYQQMCSILRNSNVTRYEQLEGAQQEEFLKARADRYDANSCMHRASADIISSSHSAVDAIIFKGQLEASNIMSQYIA